MTYTYDIEDWYWIVCVWHDKGDLKVYFHDYIKYTRTCTSVYLWYKIQLKGWIKSDNTYISQLFLSLILIEREG